MSMEDFIITVYCLVDETLNKCVRNRIYSREALNHFTIDSVSHLRVEESRKI
jgi:hypothetical protein